MCAFITAYFLPSSAKEAFNEGGYNDGINIIPTPVSLIQQEGRLTLKSGATYYASTAQAKTVADFFVAKLKTVTGFKIAAAKQANSATIAVVVNPKLNIHEEMLRPYFELSQVKKGVFGLAEKLYGIRFKLNPEIPVYHPEVEAYEVYDQNNKLLAIFYADFHPRAGKRSGAWMTSFKEQWIVSESTCIEFSISGTHAD